ncbi:beta-N-acetylhexosaminidase [Evansella tamaricis]|uniref:Beta-N-acetylhexosaminidase n=1 Tax=Evansella tamaricis TaxID=2069301 RepID=A0ABS6JGD9_9BACI|nr:beta-N-acetylhexosaminidase [Evansella tamaricis]MBU9712708.1 beta-N-acetylhexosaminidase [Evansella tamaricis]
MTKPVTLKEKTGQLFILSVPNEELDEKLKTSIRDYNIGGLILFQQNLRDFQKVTSFIQDIQAYAKEVGRPPLWISIDQEGGGIAYLWKNMVVSPGNMLLGATGNPTNAYTAHFHMGEQLLNIGFNMNFAPVLDINNNPLNPVIGARSFGENKELVTEFGIQSIKGLHDAGILACGKHYPGHGDTEMDSHLSLPTVDKSLGELEAFELYPFHESMNHGLEAVMTAHILYPQIDPEKPATLSPLILQNILRDRAGFEGLVITDSMEMEAISTYFGREKGTVMALHAGADIILACGGDYERQWGMIDAAIHAVEQGELQEQVIDTAYGRNKAYKKKWIRELSQDKGNVKLYDSDSRLKQTMEVIASKGITVVQDPKNLLPVTSSRDMKPFVIYQTTFNDENYMGDRKNAAPSIFPKEVYQSFAVQGSEPTDQESREMVDAIQSRQPVIILLNERRQLKRKWRVLMDRLGKKTSGLIVASLWNPQLLEAIPSDSTFIACYSNTEHVLKALERILRGEVIPTGKSPVTILGKESDGNA